MSTVILHIYIYTNFLAFQGPVKTKICNGNASKLPRAKFKKPKMNLPLNTTSTSIWRTENCYEKKKTHPKRPAKDESNHAPAARCECLLRQLRRLGNPRQHGHTGAVVHPASWRTANCWSRLYLSIPWFSTMLHLLRQCQKLPLSQTYIYEIKNCFWTSSMD